MERIYIKSTFDVVMTYVLSEADYTIWADVWERHITQAGENVACAQGSRGCKLGPPRRESRHKLARA